ncbi:MAG TPA: hypothetical protein VNA04_16055 [Thermoanaerobaculia bacterium]|nr:hypothetical protein [Thermoanaerobaculia bacterium]
MAQAYKAADVPALRRIGLLALRVGEDEPGLRRPMLEISGLLDQIQSAVALGRPLPPSEINRLRRLLETVSRRRSSRSVVQAAMLDELHDLARALRAD